MRINFKAETHFIHSKNMSANKVAKKLKEHIAQVALILKHDDLIRERVSQCETLCLDLEDAKKIKHYKVSKWLKNCQVHVETVFLISSV